jgi:hypothetical protein
VIRQDGCEHEELLDNKDGPSEILKFWIGICNIHPPELLRTHDKAMLLITAVMRSIAFLLVIAPAPCTPKGIR